MRWKLLQVKSEGERLYCATVRHLLPWERTSTASPSLRSGSRDLATDPLWFPTGILYRLYIASNIVSFHKNIPGG